MMRVALIENAVNKIAKLAKKDLIFMICMGCRKIFYKMIVKDKEIKSYFINFVVSKIHHEEN